MGVDGCLQGPLVRIVVQLACILWLAVCKPRMHLINTVPTCAPPAGGYDSELEGALAAGHVGAPLQPSDRALLRLRPLRHYEAGELVAVKRRLAGAAAAPPGQAAAAAAEARAAGPPAPAVGDEGGLVLCYARVAMDAAPQPGQAAYRLSVEVAPGMYESLLSTQVGGA